MFYAHYCFFFFLCSLLCLNLEKGKSFSFVKKGTEPAGYSLGGGDGPRVGPGTEVYNRGRLAAVFCETRESFTYQTHGLGSTGEKKTYFPKDILVIISCH